MHVNSNYSSLEASGLSQASGVSSSGSPSSVPPPPGSQGATTTSISSPGQLFSDLQQLSQQNPTQFQSVAAQLASSFQTAAGQASGPQAQFLTNVANQLTQAAQTGTLSAPQSAGSATPAQSTAQAASTAQTASAAPAQSASSSSQSGGAHHHHHHHHGGSSQSSQVQEAFQSAISVVSQALQGGSTTGSATTPATT